MFRQCSCTVWTETEPSASGRKDPVYQEMQIALENELARKVRVKADRKGGGVVEITFYSKEDLGNLAFQIAGE